MKRFYYIFIAIVSFALCETINIPNDYATIQAGIDAAMEGDTVLVAPDTYYENLVIEKTITLASHAILNIQDLENGWVSEDGDSYALDNDIIQNTVISGQLANSRSVIFINSPPDLGCIAPEVFGFTIEDGSGTITLVDRVTSEGELYQEELNMGGGIFVYNALPSINYNLIQDCQCNRECKLYKGAGISFSTNIGFPTTLNIETSNYRCEGDLDFSNNMFLNNNSTYGSSFYSDDFNGYIDLTNSTFDVYDLENEGVPEYYVSIDSNTEYDTSGGQGNQEAITQEVWVSPTGDDNNSGLSPETALQTIDKAIERLYIPQGEQGIIYLTEGYFNTSEYGAEGINLVSNIALVGQGPDITIVGQNNNGYPYRIFEVSDIDNTTISNLSIIGGGTEGYPDEERVGGAIKAHDSNLYLENLLIKDNFSIYGGSLNFLNSNVILNDVHIKNNQGYSVVGIQAQSTNELHELRLIDSSITNNQNIWGNPIGSTRGLAIRSWDNSIAIINSTISNNNMTYGNGNNLIPNPGEPGTLLFLSYGLQNNNPFGATAHIYNSIIWDNHTSDSRDDVSYAGIPTYIFSSRTESSEWVGYQQGPFPALFSCIDNNPEFVNPNNGDYNLNETSPCIDAGRTDLGSFGMVENYSGLAPDMGAFEFCSSGVYDCLGVCNGDAIVDDCGDCNGNNAVQDCLGVCEGVAELDECGVCNGPGLDECGTCDGSIIDLGCGCGEPIPEENYDCNGDCQGLEAIITISTSEIPYSSSNDPLEFYWNDRITYFSLTEEAMSETNTICFDSDTFNLQSELMISSTGNDLIIIESIEIDISQINFNTNMTLNTSEGDGWLSLEEEDCLGNTANNLGLNFLCPQFMTFYFYCNFDCMGICDGNAIEDCAGVCDGNAIIDDCGICNGDNDCPDILLGDINFDQAIDILDIVLLLNYIIGNSEFTEQELVAADYTGDSIINILDIVSLVNFIIRD